MEKSEFKKIEKDFSITMLIGLLLGTGVAFVTIGYEILSPLSAFGLQWIIFSLVWMLNVKIIRKDNIS